MKPQASAAAALIAFIACAIAIILAIVFTDSEFAHATLALAFAIIASLFLTTIKSAPQLKLSPIKHEIVHPVFVRNAITEYRVFRQYGFDENEARARTKALLSLQGMDRKQTRYIMSQVKSV